MPPHYHDATPTSIRSFIVKKTLLILAAALFALSIAVPASVDAEVPLCPPSGCHAQ
jgi:hypothetical protein